MSKKEYSELIQNDNENKNKENKFFNWFIEAKENIKKKFSKNESKKLNKNKENRFKNFNLKFKKLEEYTNNFKEKLYKSYSIPKETLNNYFRIQMEKILLNFLNKQPLVIKDSLKDEYMFDFIKKFIDDSVDEYWPDIEDQILFQFRLKFNKPIMPIETEYNYSWCCFSWIRNNILYILFPNDKTSWQKIRNPFFWILSIIKSIPFFGIQQGFALMIFLMIDKSDEYQLIEYILNFKKLQFITMGILSGIIAYFSYFRCSNYSNNKDLDDFYNCAIQGPQNLVNFWIDIGGLLLQMLLIWISYIFLFWANPKGSPSFRYMKKNKKLESSRGGRLGKFMFFEFLNELVILGLFYYFYKTLDFRNANNVNSSVYFIKVVYGILSFPFFIFILSPLIVLFTRSRETMYDKNGNCVPYIPELHHHQVNKYSNKKLAKIEEKDEFLKIDDFDGEITEDEDLKV